MFTLLVRPSPPGVSINQPGFDVYPDGALWVIEVLVDFVFMSDVGLNFRTTVLAVDTKETITDVKEIALR